MLCLDGGGSKGMYTLGVLCELEALLGGSLCNHFDRVYGTSTGSIIATAIALGMSVSEIRTLYVAAIPQVMSSWFRWRRDSQLRRALHDSFGEAKANELACPLIVACTDWEHRKLVLFKSEVGLAHSGAQTFEPFFGCTLADAIAASCSAYPLFAPKRLQTTHGELRLVDGGFVANNPALLAYTDIRREDRAGEGDGTRILSLGTGRFAPRLPYRGLLQFIPYVAARALVELQLDAAAENAEKTVELVYKSRTCRVNDPYPDASCATSLIEHRPAALDMMWRKGRESLRSREAQIRAFLEIRGNGAPPAA
ncbi:MAG: patatin-like phospholipase family protein [Polyangiaceae bacterium]